MWKYQIPALYRDFYWSFPSANINSSCHGWGPGESPVAATIARTQTVFTFSAFYFVIFIFYENVLKYFCCIANEGVFWLPSILEEYTACLSNPPMQWFGIHIYGFVQDCSICCANALLEILPSCTKPSMYSKYLMRVHYWEKPLALGWRSPTTSLWLHHIYLLHNWK